MPNSSRSNIEVTLGQISVLKHHLGNKTSIKWTLGVKSIARFMHARDTILHIQHHIIINKAYRKFQPDLLKIFGENVKKVKKCMNYA